MERHPTPLQLNASAFASCLTLQSSAPPGALPNLPLIKQTYNLTAADGLLLYVAFYAGKRFWWLNTTQQKAFERWSTPYWPLESRVADHLKALADGSDEQDESVVTPDGPFAVAEAACSETYGHNASSLCATLVVHNVLRALGRNYTYVDSHGVDYLPDWYKADREGWRAVANRLMPKMLSLQVDGRGCRAEGGHVWDICWGEWYHTFGVLAFGVHEAAELGPKAGDLVSHIAAALNAVYVRVVGGKKENQVKARIDTDAATVAAQFVQRGALPSFPPAACQTRAGYVRRQDLSKGGRSDDGRSGDGRSDDGRSGEGEANDPVAVATALVVRLLGPERAALFTLVVDPALQPYHRQQLHQQLQKTPPPHEQQRTAQQRTAQQRTAPTGVSSSFTISTLHPTGRIEVRGSDVGALASGVHHYLSAVNASVSWAATGGDNLQAALPPSGLPPVQPFARSTTLARRYYFNTCTYGYSLVWWQWARWERELDWMALQGINTPLAMLGAEWVWREVFTKDFGLSRADLDGFFAGPAFLPWHWMGNLDGVGGPLPDAWIERGRALQHRFLARALALGMTPILPAFAGFVPAAFKRKFPSASLRNASRWNNFPATHYLEPTSELFSRIGQAFVKRLCAEFNCEHAWFTADLYNELTPPSTDPAYLRSVSAAVYTTIAKGVELSGARRSDAPPPVWLAQAWMWHSTTHTYRPPWTEAAIRGFLSGPPRGGLVMLDLYAEQSPLWNETRGFWGTPWIFSTIFNFGGRSGVYGRVPTVAKAVPNAVAANTSFSASMVGTGAAPEAIETSPIMYDLLFESAWRGAQAFDDVAGWVRGWAARRYATFGVTTPAAALEAWVRLLDGPLGTTRVQEGPVASILAARPAPALPQVSCCDRSDLGYDPQVVLDAWRMLLSAGASGTLAAQPTFLHDVADIGIQALSNLALAAHKGAAGAMREGNLTAFRAAAGRLLSIIDDAESLAATQEGRLLGQWIATARACATDESGAEARAAAALAGEGNAASSALALADLYERNARNLISLWGGPTSRLHEYSYRLWGGMIRTFYRPRWAKWLADVEAAMAAGERFNQSRFDADIEQWEYAWGQQTGVDLPTTPSGGALQLAEAVHARHFGEVWSGA